VKRILSLAICLVLMAGLFSCFAPLAFSQEASDLKPFIDTVDQSQKGMTLWQLIKTGGFIMVVLGLLSIATIFLIVLNFQNLQTVKLAPRDLAENVIQKLEKKQYKLAQEMCASQDNIISRIVLSGLEKRPKGAIHAKEAMENCGRKEIASLWQTISYLADIAAIAPMVGLLGTVIGMIQAFNVIAFQTAVVKPILLAGGVSKAMVTTASGLIVAIPAMILYAYFRGRVQEISNEVENYSTDIIKIIEES